MHSVVGERIDPCQKAFSALAFAGFVIGMDKHDRAAALTAFEAVLSVSPSSALTYILGSVIFADSVKKSAASGVHR
jgi:hypothetical protein